MRRGKDVSSFLSEFDSVTHVPRPNNAKNTNRLNNKNHTLPTHPFNFPRAANLFNVAAGNVHQLLSYLYDRSIFPSSRLIVRSKIKRCKSLPSCSSAFVFFFPPVQVSRSSSISQKISSLSKHLLISYSLPLFSRSYLYMSLRATMGTNPSA